MNCKYCNEPGASICDECQVALAAYAAPTLLDNPLYNIVECKRCNILSTPQSYNDDSGICTNCQSKSINGKQCKRCKKVKPNESFGKNKLIEGGYHYYCKVCARQLAQERRV